MKYYCAKCNKYYGEKLEKGCKCKCGYNGFTCKEMKKIEKRINKVLNKAIN